MKELVKGLYPVPENWRHVSLADVADIIMGQSPSGADTTEDPAYMPLIGGAADLGTLYPSPSRYTKRPAKVSADGDIILCIRATLGRPVFSDGVYCLGRGVAAIRPRIGAKEFYRYCFLNFEQYLYDNAAGSTFAQVSKAVLQDMPIPFPPLSEQRRIVSHVESLFSKLDEAAEKLQVVVDGYELRRAAILHKAFTGKLTAKWREEHGVGMESWTTKKFRNFCLLKRGFDLPASQRVKGKYPLVSSSGIIDQHCAAAAHGPGVVTGRSGSIGKVFYVEEDYWPLNTTLYSENLFGNYARYVYYFLQTFDFKSYSASTAVPTLNRNLFLDEEFLVPENEEQREIVRLLEQFLNREEQAHAAAKVALSQISLMKKSILARAFRGELGTNDPAEPPAAPEEL